MVNLLEDYGEIQTISATQTLLQISYYTVISQGYTPLQVANIVVFLGSQFSEEGYQDLDVDQTKKDFRSMLRIFQVEFAGSFCSLQHKSIKSLY